jgi:hypothetical protein
MLSYTYITRLANHILYVCRPSWRKFKTEYWQNTSFKSYEFYEN